MEENTDINEKNNKDRIYSLIFLTSLIYNNEKYIELSIKESQNTPEDDDLNKNEILKKYNKDKYDDIKEIHKSHINIPIRAIFRPQGELDGYNIYSVIRKNTLEYKLAKLVIENNESISKVLEENYINKKGKAVPNKYKAHEKFTTNYKEEFINSSNEEILIPMTYMGYCINAYNRFLSPGENKGQTSTTCKWEDVIKFNKDNIDKIIPKYSNYIFENNNKLKYDDFLDKLSVLELDIKSLISNKKKDMKYNLNTFIKGVPGTGKSMKVKQLTSDIKKENILKINIHSDMSSSDIIQGISVNINQYNNLIYKEKYGVILRRILKAILNPSERFAIVLEEIQEKALNKLIGSLIHLIEDDKRVSCDDIKDLTKGKEREIQNDDIDEVFKLIDNIVDTRSDIEFINIPNLIEGSNKERKLILPDNVYFFLTTNYRNDKVVIEDNMLRRFSIIEMYPEYKDTVDYGNDFVSDFLQNLNKNIIEVFSDEIHPERMLIGHASWMRINTCEEFYNNFIKFVVEFNDIRLIEYSQFKQIFNKELWTDFFKYSEREDNKVYKCITNIIKKICDGETNSYFELIYSIQKELRKEAQI